MSFEEILLQTCQGGEIFKPYPLVVYPTLEPPPYFSRGDDGNDNDDEV